MQGHRIQFTQCTWCATLALIATAVTLSGQGAPAATPQSQTIRGRVLAGDSGQPLSNARVLVSGTAVGVRTDLEGRFTISVAAGQMLRVLKAGYIGQEVKPPAGAIRLVRAGAITGHVLDDRGDPVVGVYVVAATADQIRRATNQLARSLTDDRGEYRIGGVAPGTYTVSVTTAGVGVTTIDLGNGGITMSPPGPGHSFPTRPIRPTPRRCRSRAVRNRRGLTSIWSRPMSQCATSCRTS